MCRRVRPRSLSSTFEISPVWYLAASFLTCGLVSLNAGQRWTESGRKPARDGSGGPPGFLAGRHATRRHNRPADLLGDAHGDPPQHLRVELVGAALDLALVLVEAGDDLVAVVDRE